ncbi:GRAM domain-containing protein 1B isoform X1 [Lates japonicus]
MSDTLRPPSLQVSVPNDAPAYSDGGSNAVSDGSMRSSSSTPTLRRKRFKMRRMRNVPSERELERGRLNDSHLTARSHSGSKEYLQLPSIEITPSSDEDAPSSWSRCSTPSASPRRKRFLLRKWLKVREKKEQGSESRLVWALPTHLSPFPSSPHIFPNTSMLLQGSCCPH